MLAGPIFSREVLTAPRQVRHFLLRAGYVAGLMGLVLTIRLVTIGFENVPQLGASARFGNLVFQVLSLVQMSLMLFFALLYSAAGIAQEKDRQTLILLLMTDMRDRELVLGKLGANLLNVVVLIVCSIPVFFLVHHLGGVTVAQITWSLLLCAASAFAAGSWGAMVGFWREKTFQTLAISVLGVVLFIGVIEAIVGVVGAGSDTGRWVGLFDPFRSLMGILSPLTEDAATAAAQARALGSVAVMGGLSLVFIAVTTWRLRDWNPSQAVYRKPSTTGDRTRSRHRAIWNVPVFWREIRTSAYGRKVIVIKLAYVALALFVGKQLIAGDPFGEKVLGMISPLGFAFVGLGLLTFMLVNAQAVTSLTSERDGRTLELLMMTDVTAKQFIFGKLGGALYNWKEAIVVPLLLVAYFVATGDVTIGDFLLLTIGYLVLIVFAATLGIHAGLTYDQSRAAIANSLGTMFFLFVGIFISMLLLIEARASFPLQLLSFGVFIGAGSIALTASLTHKNPSAALLLGSALLPFLTFYSITEFLLQGTIGVCIWISAAYGFTTVAMLVPAVSEFEVALGHSTHDKG